MKVIIGFSYPSKFKIGAWLISKWMGVPYSHVYIRYTDGQGRDLVFHAAHGLVHLILVKNFKEENNVIKEYELNTSNEQYESFRDFYYNKIGLPYSYAQLIYIPIHDVLWKLGMYFKGQDDRGFICSELASDMLKEIFNYEFNKPFNLCRPDDVEKALIRGK